MKIASSPIPPGTTPVTAPLRQNQVAAHADVKWASDTALISGPLMGPPQGFPTLEAATAAAANYSMGEAPAIAVYRDGSTFNNRPLFYDGTPGQGYYTWRPYNVGIFGERGIVFKQQSVVQIVDGATQIKR